MARATAVGIEAVRRIAAELKLEGVYGPLIELIEADPMFETAIEVAAKGSLFHIVVDSDETASRVLEAFNRDGVVGRVSFMPLNRIKAKQREYPAGGDIKPLVDVIRCDDRFRKAVIHAFGKTLICRDLEVAAMTAKQHKLDCITLDGKKNIELFIFFCSYF